MTATNPNVNIIQWFADNIIGDLQASASSVHPVLQVDAIRYLYTFRYQVLLRVLMRSWPPSNTYVLGQLTKEQLVSVLPLLLSRLDSQDIVVHTYVAVALDRILSMRVGDSNILLYVFLASNPPSLFLFTISLQVFIFGRSIFCSSTLKCPPFQD